MSKLYMMSDQYITWSMKVDFLLSKKALVNALLWYSIKAHLEWWKGSSVILSKGTFNHQSKNVVFCESLDPWVFPLWRSLDEFLSLLTQRNILYPTRNMPIQQQTVTHHVKGKVSFSSDFFLNHIQVIRLLLHFPSFPSVSPLPS